MRNPLEGADPESLDEAALSPPSSENVPTDECSSLPPPPRGARHSLGMDPVSSSADLDPPTVVGSR